MMQAFRETPRFLHTCVERISPFHVAKCGWRMTSAIGLDLFRQTLLVLEARLALVSLEGQLDEAVEEFAVRDPRGLEEA